MSNKDDNVPLEEEPVEGETIQEEEPTAEQVMPASMKGFTIVQIISCIENEIDTCRKKLENEPSGRVLAYLQGKIPGCKFGLEAIREIFSLNDDFFDMIEKPITLSQLSQEEILGVEEDMGELKKTELWQKFLSQVQTRADELKDYLLFKAKKSRDLDVSQGEYNGMVLYQKLFDSIKDNAKFWKDSLFKRSEEESGGLRDANDADPSLLPPGLPAPEDDEYEDPEERGDESWPVDVEDEEQEVDSLDSEDEDPDVDMGTAGDEPPEE